MNDSNSAQQFSQPYQSPLLAPKKPFPTALAVLGVVGILLILAVMGGIKLFHSAQSGSTAAIAVGNSFIDEVGQHHYSAAHAMLTTPIQAKTPAATLQDVETLIEKHHGQYRSHGKPQWFIQNYNGQTSVRLTYPVQYTKSISTVTMVVIKTDKGYQVYDAHYEF